MNTKQTATEALQMDAEWLDNHARRIDDWAEGVDLADRPLVAANMRQAAKDCRHRAQLLRAIAATIITRPASQVGA